MLKKNTEPKKTKSNKQQQNTSSTSSISVQEIEEEEEVSIKLPQFIPIYKSIEDELEDSFEESRYWKFAESKEYDSFLASHPHDIPSWIEAAFLVPFSTYTYTDSIFSILKIYLK